MEAPSSIISSVSRDDNQFCTISHRIDKANGVLIQQNDQINNNNNLNPSNVTTTITVVNNGTNNTAAIVVEPSSDCETGHNRQVVGRQHFRRFYRMFVCCFCSKKSHEHKAPDASNSQIDGSVATSVSIANSQKPLLSPRTKPDLNKKCMIIDLDETLVHSSFKPINNADFIVPVEIDGIAHQVYVLKRPYVDMFLKRMGELYECVLFTASLAKYADPVADLLDVHGTFRARLFRDSCVFHRGNYVKDLNRLGRDLKKIIIVDNSPASYLFHPDNAVPVSSWFEDLSDTELRDLIPFFEKLSTIDNVYKVLCNSKHPYNSMYQAHLRNTSRSNLTIPSSLTNASPLSSPSVSSTATITNSFNSAMLPSTSLTSPPVVSS